MIDGGIIFGYCVLICSQVDEEFCFTAFDHREFPTKNSPIEDRAVTYQFLKVL